MRALRSRWRPLALVALLGAALAAGGFLIERARGARIVPGAEAAALCLRAAEQFCGELERCGGLASPQRPACVERHAADCDADIGWRLRRGVLALNAEAQEECLEGLASAQCGAVQSVLGDDDQDVLELTSQCELDELRPTSRLGGPCALPSDCAEGSCPYAEPGCHVCRPFARVGESCAAGADTCDPAVAWCRFSEAGGRCAALLPPGERCGEARECLSGLCASANGERRCAARGESTGCSSAADCASDSFCQAGRCARRAATGAGCSAASAEACLDPEARCVGGRCRIRPFSERAGASCADFSDCQSGLYCREGSAPGGAGACARQSVAGEACRPGDYGGCIASSRCVRGVCQPLAREGEPCTGPYLCTAELECIPRSADAGFAGGATCLAPAAVGQPCGPYRSCRGGYCREGADGGASVCIAKAAAGAACFSREECASGRCEPERAGPSRCQPSCG